MKHRTIYSIATLVVAAGVIVGIVAAGAGTGNPSAEERVNRAVDGVMSQFKGEDMVKIAGPNEDDVLYTKSSDFEAMVRASSAKQLGLPYDPSDEMAPVVDKNGTKVGYFARGTGFIPVEVADAPGFDLCALIKERGAVTKGQLPDGTWVVQDPC